jgi:hypothetical protein
MMKVGGIALMTSVALGSGNGISAEGDVRWRMSGEGDEALLATSDSEGTDNFGPLMFNCKKGSGLATAEGDMSNDLRATIAAIILHDEEPSITMVPDDSSAFGVEAFTGMTGWHYRFRLSVTGPAFEQLVRAGSFHVKIGDSLVSSDFKVGLENVRRFQDFCKAPSK